MFFKLPDGESVVKPSTPLIMTACPTGMAPTQCDHRWLPVSADEIAADAVACSEEGASRFLLPSRDENGAPTGKAEVQERVVPGLRKACPEAILWVSTSGRSSVAHANVDLVRRAAVLARTVQRTVTTPAPARQTVGLPPTSTRSLDFHPTD